VTISDALQHWTFGVALNVRGGEGGACGGGGGWIVEASPMSMVISLLPAAKCNPATIPLGMTKVMVASSISVVAQHVGNSSLQKVTKLGRGLDWRLILSASLSEEAT
tara:strand:+ start:429 stop:749 length:321 start_codon:yes stop_codon:yes gene_type:complete